MIVKMFIELLTLIEMKHRYMDLPWLFNYPYTVKPSGFQLLATISSAVVIEPPQRGDFSYSEVSLGWKGLVDTK